MNPFRTNDEPTESMGEVARARIHEEHETKRKLIEEREKTKRERLGTDGHWVTRGLMVVTVFAAVICGAIVSNGYFSDRKPPAPAACLDEAFAVGGGMSQYNRVICSNAHHVSRFEKRGDQEFLVCQCSVAHPSASASSVAPTASASAAP
jgi:hypothetical protein